MNKTIKLITVIFYLTFSLSCTETVPKEHGDFGSIKYEGKTYKTVKIGNQIWMAENLAYLPQINLTEDYSESESKFYVCTNSSSNLDSAKMNAYYKKYGVLYNWPAAKNACPGGWHLPTNEDWQTLLNYIDEDNGGYESRQTGSTYTWFKIGIHLRAEKGWPENQNGVDTYGFSTLPAGIYNWSKQRFEDIDQNSAFWSATQNEELVNVYATIDEDMINAQVDKEPGLSVRCIKN